MSATMRGWLQGMAMRMTAGMEKAKAGEPSLGKCAVSPYMPGELSEKVCSVVSSRRCVAFHKQVATTWNISRHS